MTALPASPKRLRRPSPSCGRKRHKIVLSPNIHPHYRDVVRTYHQGGSLQIVGDEGENERLDAQHITALLDKDTAMLAVAYPKFLRRN